MADKQLERSLRTITSSANTLTVDSLKDIASIRAALEVFSTYLGSDFLDNMQRFESLPACLTTVKHLCSHPSRSFIQLFLLKLLVRQDPNGIEAVKERCKIGHLQWILPPQYNVSKSSSFAYEIVRTLP